MSQPKVLVLDIETSLMLVYVWQLKYNNYISHEQIKDDWFVMSWAAKWLGESKVMQMDCRDSQKDKGIIKELWKLIDEADIVVGQNSNSFDLLKVNARAKIHGLLPPSPYKKIDTMLEAQKNFGFSSYKLEYMANTLKLEHTKSKHEKYPGLKLWIEAQSGNMDAWSEMAKYNKVDVLVTEELFNEVIPWSFAIDFSLWDDSPKNTCTCGSDLFVKGDRFVYTSVGKFNKWKCANAKCGKWTRGSTNLFSKEKRTSLRRKIT